jgi:GINS complex subunit 2
MLANPLDISVSRIAPGFSDEEFLAEECMIEIQPHFNAGEPLRFISQECGPFDRRTPTRVPLWVGIYLEKHGKCTIRNPDWLSVPYIKAKVREERERGTGTFATLDDHSVQVAVILLNRDYLTSEYLGGHAVRSQMQTLLTELLMIRKAKMIEGLKQIDLATSVVDITNMTSIERASIRSQSSMIMDQLRELWTIRDHVLLGETRGM